MYVCPNWIKYVFTIIPQMGGPPLLSATCLLSIWFIYFYKFNSCFRTYEICSHYNEMYVKYVIFWILLTMIFDSKDLYRRDPLDFEKHIWHSKQITKIFLLFQIQSVIRFWLPRIVSTPKWCYNLQSPLFFAMNFLAAGVVVVFQGQEIETFDRAWHTMGQSLEFCKETSPHCQCYLFGIKWL